MATRRALRIELSAGEPRNRSLCHESRSAGLSRSRNPSLDAAPAWERRLPAIHHCTPKPPPGRQGLTKGRSIPLCGSRLPAVPGHFPDHALGSELAVEPRIKAFTTKVRFQTFAALPAKTRFVFPADGNRFPFRMFPAFHRPETRPTIEQKRPPVNRPGVRQGKIRSSAHRKWGRPIRREDSRNSFRRQRRCRGLPFPDRTRNRRYYIRTFA